MDFNKQCEALKEEFNNFLKSDKTEWSTIFFTKDGRREGANFFKTDYKENFILIYYKKPLFKNYTSNEIEKFLKPTGCFAGIYKKDTNEFFVDVTSLSTVFFLKQIEYDYRGWTPTYSSIENWVVDCVNEIHEANGIKTISRFSEEAIPFVCDAIAAGGRENYKKEYLEKVSKELL